MTNQEAIEKIQYRIDTASEIVGKGEDGKAFEDMEMAIKALEKLDKINSDVNECCKKTKITIKQLQTYVKFAHNEGFGKDGYRYINPCLVDIYHKKTLKDHDTGKPRTCYYIKYQDDFYYIDAEDLSEIVKIN